MTEKEYLERKKNKTLNPEDVDLALEELLFPSEINPELIASFERFEAYWASRGLTINPHNKHIIKK